MAAANRSRRSSHLNAPKLLQCKLFSMDPVIIGGGVAGLACAAAIRHTRMDQPTLIERRPLATHGGLGFLLMPTGIEALQKLAPGIDFRSTGQAITQIEMRGLDGSLLDARRLESTTCVSRERFLMALRAAGDASSIYGKGADGFTRAEDGLVQDIVLDDGQRVAGDLFFACDGVDSRARGHMFPHAQLGAVIVKEVVSSVTAPELAKRLGQTFHKYYDPRGGLAIGLLAESAERIVWFVQFDPQRFPGVEPNPTSMARFARDVTSGVTPLVEGLVKITDFSKSYLWATRDLLPLDQLSIENTVLVGDAAHACLPFTSQGANGALVDAALLASLLAEVTDQGEVRRAFDAYSRQRRARNHQVFAEGRKLRDAFLQPLGQRPPAIPLVQ